MWGQAKSDKNLVWCWTWCWWHCCCCSSWWLQLCQTLVLKQMSTSPSKHEERITWLLQWIDQTIKFRNSWGHSAEAAAIMIEKKQRKKLKRKKSESLSDRFLLGVSHIYRFKMPYFIVEHYLFFILREQSINAFGEEYYCAQSIRIGHDIVTLSSFLVERLHQRGAWVN